MQEPTDLDIKIGPEIDQTLPPPRPEPIADLPINLGQPVLENLFSKGELPTGSKEVGSPKKDLTVSFIEGRTLQQIFDYMSEERNRERGGSLVGRYLETTGGRIAHITDFVPAKTGPATGASIQFTADDYSEVDPWIKQNKLGSQFVGWVHSHPFYTPAPSAHDVFIMENFFNIPHQVTMIVNQNTRELGDFRLVNGQVENTGGFYLNPSGLQGLEIAITADTRLDQKSGSQKVTLNSLPDASGAMLKVDVDYSTFQRFQDKIIGSIDKFISLFKKFGSLLSTAPEQRIEQLLTLTQADIDRSSPDEILRITSKDLGVAGGNEEMQPAFKITSEDIK